MVEYETDDTFEFKFNDVISPEYGFAVQIIDALNEYLTSLTDDHGNKLFNKVNNGFNENQLKNWGNRPICDIYINSFEYDDDFDISKPSKAHVILLCYTKGANNNTYHQISMVHDYLVQCIGTDNKVRYLNGIANGCNLEQTQLMVQPIRKAWAMMASFEITYLI